MIRHIRADLRALVERRRSDLAHDNFARSQAAGDVGAGGRGHQIAGDVDRAVDIHEDVNAVIGGAGMGHGRRERQRHRVFLVTKKYVIPIGCLVPLIAVVYEEVNVAAQGYRCPLVHSDAGTRQQFRGIGDGCCAGVHIDVNVVGNRQDVFGGRQGDAADGHGNGRERRISVDVDDHAVLSGVVMLGDGAAGAGAEETVAGSNEGNIRHVAGAAGGIHRHIQLFLCAVLECYGRFDVLYIVLGHRENLLAVVVQAGQRGAAAELGQLEALLDHRTALGRDRAVAGDIAVGVEVRAAVKRDGAAAEHINASEGLGGASGDSGSAAAHGISGGRHADIAVNSQVGPVGHGQAPELYGFYIRPVVGCLNGCHDGMCAVVRNQKRNTGGDRVIAGIERSGIRQDDVLGRGGRSSGVRLVQIQIIGIANQEHRAALWNKLRLDGDIIFDIEGCRIIGAQVFAAGHVVPAVEVISFVRRCLQHKGDGRALSTGNGRGHWCPVQRERSVFSRLEGHCSIDSLDLQRDVRERHRYAGADAVVAVGTGDDHRSGCAGRQFNGFCSAGSADRGPTDFQRTVIRVRRPVKGQIRCSAEVIGQRQRSRHCGVVAAPLAGFHIAFNGIPAGNRPCSVFISGGKTVDSQAG